MAKLALWGSTALEVYRHADEALPLAGCPADADLADYAPIAPSLRYLAHCLPWLSTPFHVAVFSTQQRRNLKDARCHIVAESVAKIDFFRVASGIVAPSPEIAYLQACARRPQEALVFEGTELCGRYALDPTGQKLLGRKPLTTIERLRLAAAYHRDIGGCAAAKRALPWLVENAASPREAVLALLLSLPNHRGGYGLPKPCLNHSIDLGVLAGRVADKSYYVADLCWPEARLIVEYDSDEFHLASSHLASDANRRMALNDRGYRLITVTRLQLNSAQEMDRVALALARALACPIRFRVAHFPDRQATLRTALGLPH